MIGLSLLVSCCTYIAVLSEFDVLNYSRGKNPNSWTNLMIIVLGNSNVASKLRLYSQVCRSFLGKLDLFLHKYFAHSFVQIQTLKSFRCSFNCMMSSYQEILFFSTITGSAKLGPICVWANVQQQTWLQTCRDKARGQPIRAQCIYHAGSTATHSWRQR